MAVDELEETRTGDPITDIKAGAKDDELIKKYKLTPDEVFSLRKYNYVTTKGGMSEEDAQQMYAGVTKYLPVKAVKVTPGAKAPVVAAKGVVPVEKGSFDKDPFAPYKSFANGEPQATEVMSDEEGNRRIKEDQAALDVGASLMRAQGRETVAKQMGVPVPKEPSRVAATWMKNGMPEAPLTKLDKEKLAEADKKQAIIDQNQQAADLFYETPEGRRYYDFMQSTWRPLVNAGKGMLAGGVRLASKAGGPSVKRMGDDVADNIADYLDFEGRSKEDRKDAMLYATPTKLQGGLYKDGKVNGAKFIPTTMETLTNMAVLVGGAGGTKAGLGAVSYLTTVEEYRKEGKEAGLQGGQLDSYSQLAAAFTTGLEFLSPNNPFTGAVKRKLMKEAVKDIAKGVTVKQAVGRVVKEASKEVTKENIQEFSQGAADLGMKVAYGIEGDSLDPGKLKDQAAETFVMTSLATLLLGGAGIAHGNKPTSQEKGALKYAAENREKFHGMVDNQVAAGKFTPEQGQTMKDQVGKYSLRTEGLQRLGYDEDKAANISYAVHKHEKISQKNKIVTESPVLNATLGKDVKKQQEDVENEIKDAALGIPDVGTEIEGEDLSKLVDNTPNRPQALVERVQDKTYRVEEIDLEEKYKNDPAFKKAVDEYEKSGEDPEGLRMPPIVRLDGKVEDGNKRLVQQYVNGEKKARVFKELVSDYAEGEVSSGPKVKPTLSQQNPNFVFPATRPGTKNVKTINYRGKDYKFGLYEERDSEDKPNWFAQVFSVDGKTVDGGHEFYFGKDRENEKVSAYGSMKEMVSDIERFAAQDKLEVMPSEGGTEVRTMAEEKIEPYDTEVSSASRKTGETVKPESTTASVPVMITKKMEEDLKAKGHTQEAINKMTPQQAHDALAAPVQKEVAAKLESTEEDISGEEEMAEHLAKGTLPVTDEELGQMLKDHKQENDGTETGDTKTDSKQQASDEGVHGKSDTGKTGGLSEEHVSEDDQKTDAEKAKTKALKKVAAAFSKRFGIPTEVITPEQAEKLLAEDESKEWFFQILDDVDVFKEMDPVKAKEFILKVFNTVADKDEAKKAYRKLANKYHPDKHQTPEAQKAAEDIFKYLNEANERYNAGRIWSMPKAEPAQPADKGWGGFGNQQSREQAEEERKRKEAEQKKRRDDFNKKYGEGAWAKAKQQKADDLVKLKKEHDKKQAGYKEEYLEAVAAAAEVRDAAIADAPGVRDQQKAEAQKIRAKEQLEAGKIWEADKARVAKENAGKSKTPEVKAAENRVDKKFYSVYHKADEVYLESIAEANADFANSKDKADAAYDKAVAAAEKATLVKVRAAQAQYAKDIKEIEEKYKTFNFQKTGEGGMPAGFYDPTTGKAYLVDGLANDTTPIHEIFAHPFIAAIEGRNPELYKQLLDAAKSDPDIKYFVDNNYKEASQATRDHEYIARAIDQDARGKLKNKTLIEHIKEFWEAVTEYFNEMFGGGKTQLENINSTTPLGDIVDFVLKSGESLNLDKTLKEEQAKQEAYDEVAGLKPTHIPGRIDMAPFVGKKPKSLSNIVLDLAKASKWRMFFIKPKSSKASASYTPGTGAIKIRYQGDLDGTSHEVGHALDDRYNLMEKILANPAAVAELDHFSKFGSPPPAGHPYPKRYEAGEGFAEFFRALIVNPTETEQVAPELTEIYRDNVPAKDKKALTQFSNDIRVWGGSTALEKMRANIEWDYEKPKSTVSEIFNPDKSNKGLRYNIADRIAANYVNPLSFFNKAFKFAMGVQGVDQVMEKDDPMTLVRLLYSVDTKFGEMFERGLTMADGTRLRDGNGNPLNFKWLLEPLNNADEAAINEDMKKVTEYMIAQRTVELGARFNRDDILTGVGGGMFKDVDVAKASIEELEKGDPAQLKRIREAAGRYRDFAGHILRYMVDSGRLSEEQYKKIKEDNTQYIAMHRILHSEPGQEVVAYTKTGGAKLGSTKDVLHKIKGSTKPIGNPYASLLDIMHKSIAESDRNNVLAKFTDMITATRGMNEGDVKHLSDIGQKGEGENSITVFKNGKPEKWILHPEIYKALKGIDHEYMKLPGWATFHARLLREMTTKFPTFAIRNWIKDVQARLNLTTDNSGVKDLVGSSEDWDTLALTGGLNAGYYLKNKATYYRLMKDAILEVAKDKGSIVANPSRLKRGWRAYEKLLYQSETSNRVAEFRAARRKALAAGKDEYSATLYGAYKARDLVDFAVAGHHMRVINQIIPFSNAAVQGLRSAITHAREKPGNFIARTLLFSVLPQFAEWLINHWDDDTAKEYEDLPAYRKDMFYNFKLGPNFWLSIPKPYELALVGAGVKRGLSAWASEDPKTKEHAFEGFGKSVASSLLPVDQTSLAGPFGSIMENMGNYDQFRDKTIVPGTENKLNLALRHTAVASKLAQVLQDFTGVDARKIDHTIQSEFSYYGRLATNLSNIGSPETRSHFGAEDLGVFKQSPAYDGSSVQRMMKYAEEAGLTRDQGYDKFVKQARKYFDARDDESKEKEGTILRNQADTLLEKWKKKEVLQKKIRKFKLKEEKERKKKEAAD